jgi:hypothetical protein
MSDLNFIEHIYSQYYAPIETEKYSEDWKDKYDFREKFKCRIVTNFTISKERHVLQTFQLIEKNIDILLVRGTANTCIDTY